MTFIFILSIAFLASLVRSTLGFGESLIAVPFLLLLLPANVAVPLSVILSVVIALIIVVQDYQNIHFASAKWLILYAVIGLPFGVAVLLYGHAVLIKTGLALLIITYSVYALYFQNESKGKSTPKGLLFVCGFLSGIFGGAYGLNGPPLVVYGNIQQWSARDFRATLQAYFLPVSLLSVLAYYKSGLITTQVIDLSLLALLSTVPAIFLGRYLNRRLNSKRFFRYTYWGLIVLAVVLLYSAYT